MNLLVNVSYCTRFQKFCNSWSTTWSAISALCVLCVLGIFNLAMLLLTFPNKWSNLPSGVGEDCRGPTTLLVPKVRLFNRVSEKSYLTVVKMHILWIVIKLIIFSDAYSGFCFHELSLQVSCPFFFFFFYWVVGNIFLIDS